ncbi:hypothetical protein [Actinoplanes sp. L3-i22]|uniref:hypothetical protein n=1 Tax=Actinoplanes sp. L3-i22 TaxID=2836373 RepID=UPI001C84C046|nr:hypothetical protein [Actinoplanes sp. L3-i22]
MDSTGVVIYKVGDSPRVIGGSCGAYLARHVFVTASRCVPEGAEAFVAIPGQSERNVVNIARHDTSDIAVLIAERVRGETMASEIFLPKRDALLFGGDFLAFGYPDGPLRDDLVGRLIKGHFQRFFDYDKPLGGSYFAGEMSVAVPAGMSGAPVSWRSWPQELIGVVTTNQEVPAITDSAFAFGDNGRSDRVTNVPAISYGTVAMLAGLEDWLAETCAAWL